MPLISHTIPGLYNGVSQQPATVRHPTQCEEQVNAYSSLVSGLTKRQPTEHVKFLGYPSWYADKALVHLINRDATERYVVVITNDDLKVFDLAGNEKIVSFPNGKGYLYSNNPRTSLKIITIADYSFIVNTTVTVADRGDVAPGAITGSKQLFSDLPSAELEGVIYEIAGDPTNSFDNYYVKRTGGVYLETVKPGVQLGFAPSTMPHILVRTPDGNFSFHDGTGYWADRSVGDAISSPTPSFVGNKISDIFFHRNRLGLTSRENIVFSRAGFYFDFWRESVLDVLDSDPVDVSVSHSKVSSINHAIPFNKSLLLFSEQTQFIMTASDLLTPKSVKIDQSTEFETSATVRPVGAGPNIYFVTPRGSNTSIKEYYVSEDTVTNDAADVTRHVPTYLPPDVFKIVASTTEDVLFALNTAQPNLVHVYKYYWQGEEKKQSSWSKWTFGADAKVLSLDMIGSDAYMVIYRPDGFYLEHLNLQTDLVDAVGYRVHLDRKIAMTGTYNPITGKTHWILPYAEAATLNVVLGPAFDASAGAQLAVTKVSNDELSVDGNYSYGYVYIGKPYTMQYTFSEQNIMVNNSVVLGSLLQLRTLTLDYVESGNFDVLVTPRARSTYTYTYAGKVIGYGAVILGRPQIASGEHRVPIQTNTRDVTITIQNDTPMPSNFQSAEWEAFLIQRAQHQ